MVSRPPTSRPTAAPPMLIAAYTPIARLRGGPSGNVVVTSDSAVGATIAPPTPCSARAASDQALRRGKSASQRREREQDDAGDEHPAAAKNVSGPPTEQEQPAERQRIGVDHPLQARAGEAERPLDVREGDVDDGGIQHHHQLCGGDDQQGQAQTALAAGRRRAGRGPAW